MLFANPDSQSYPFIMKPADIPNFECFNYGMFAEFEISLPPSAILSPVSLRQSDRPAPCFIKPLNYINSEGDITASGVFAAYDFDFDFDTKAALPKNNGTAANKEKAQSNEAACEISSTYASTEIFDPINDFADEQAAFGIEIPKLVATFGLQDAPFVQETNPELIQLTPISSAGSRNAESVFEYCSDKSSQASPVKTIPARAGPAFATKSRFTFSDKERPACNEAETPPKPGLSFPCGETEGPSKSRFSFPCGETAEESSKSRFSFPCGETDGPSKSRFSFPCGETAEEPSKFSFSFPCDERTVDEDPRPESKACSLMSGLWGEEIDPPKISTPIYVPEKNTSRRFCRFLRYAHAYKTAAYRALAEEYLAYRLRSNDYMTEDHVHTDVGCPVCDNYNMVYPFKAYIDELTPEEYILCEVTNSLVVREYRAPTRRTHAAKSHVEKLYFEKLYIEDVQVEDIHIDEVHVETVQVIESDVEEISILESSVDEASVIESYVDIYTIEVRFEEDIVEEVQANYEERVVQGSFEETAPKANSEKPDVVQPRICEAHKKKKHSFQKAKGHLKHCCIKSKLKLTTWKLKAEKKLCATEVKIHCIRSAWGAKLRKGFRGSSKDKL